MQLNFALLWRRDGSEGIKWYIRGVKPDGSFYGEILHMARHRASRVDGSLSPENWVRCQEILELFAARPSLSPGPCFALLARWFGSLDHAEVVFKYELGDEASSTDAIAFLELKGILEPHVSKAYVNLA